MDDAHSTAGSYVTTGQEFTRDTNYITTRITRDGAEGYPVEPGRYRLVAARACPWANRTIIVRRLLGLEDAISLGLPGPTHDARSWTFDLDPDGRDPVLGIERLQDAYFARGRVLTRLGQTEPALEDLHYCVSLDAATPTGQSCQALLNDLKKHYDMIILDTPPVGLVTDGIMAMKQADVSLYVFRADYSKKEFLHNLKRIISINKFTNITTLLNAVSTQGKTYGYGYYEDNGKSATLKSFFNNSV